MDRQDDGVAWHILVNLANKLHIELHDPDLDIYSIGTPVGFHFTLQLTPDLAEEISIFDRICFVDAHTGFENENVHFKSLFPLYQNSPLTHHMTPDTLLEITRLINNNVPEAVLVSVRGYEFGFFQTLSKKTEVLSHKAVDLIFSWINNQ